MADTQETLENNWYKAVKGMKCTRIGIKTFVEENVDSFHKKVYATHLQCLSSGSTCSECSTQNVLNCPTRNICVLHSNNKCIFHAKCFPKKCPRNICNRVRDIIINAHRYGGPSFRNTSATLWHSSSWELAKCFMAATGYQDKMSADDTDFPGIISVILNHKDFDGLVSENLGQKNNVFEQARVARKNIMHSANFEESTSDLHCHFGIFKKVLTDAKHIKGRPEAKEAVKTLHKILTDKIKITEQEKDSFREEARAAIMAIKDAGNEAIAEVRSTESTAKRNVEDAGSLASQEIERKHGEALNSIELKQQEVNKNIESSGKATIDKLTSETSEHVQELKRQAKEAEVSVTGAKDKAITELEGELENQKQEIICSVAKSVTATKTEAVKELEDRKNILLEETKATIDKSKDDAIGELIKTVEEASSQHQQTSNHDGVSQSLGLKKHLLEHYQRNGYAKLPLSPLVDDVEIDVDEVFVMPKMRVANYSQTKPASKSCPEDTIESINGMFIKDGKAINRVCIGANGGYGKTTLCQMIISAWVKIHMDKTEGWNRCIPKSDFEFLKSFDYLFYLPLRDLNGVVDVEEMIKLHLVKESLHAILAEVLRKESKKCFILLDGLDEWSGENSQTLPQIDRREHYAVLITSRPYKIERIRPRKRDVEQEIDIIGSTDPGQIVKVLVSHLNRKYKKKKDYTNFPCYSSIRIDSNLSTNIWSRFSDIPILLSHMVCLWFDGRDDYTTSRLVICFNMIDMMLEVAESKEQIHSNEAKIEKENLMHFPKRLGKLEYCKKYSNLLHSLSRLSFHKIFGENQKDALIFPREVFDMYGLNQTDIELCLKAALLSLSKFTGQATSKMKRLSFLHTTFQEVFAALYIANSGEISLQQFLEKYPSIEDLLKDSEILAYVCGLRPDFVGQVSRHIACLADAHAEIQEYRGAFPLRYVPLLVRRIQDCVLEAIEEASLEGHKIDFVELHDVCDKPYFRWTNALSGEILKSLTVNFISLNIKCRSEQQDIESLGNIIERAFSLTRLKLGSFSTLVSFKQESINYSKLLTAVSQKNLTCLEIVGFECDHHTKEQLQSIVSRQTHLVALRIASVYCTTCITNICKFKLDMSSLANLKYIVLKEVILPPKQKLSCHLERIAMKNCENVDSFLRALKFPQHITILELYFMEGFLDTGIGIPPPPEEPIITLNDKKVDTRGIKESDQNEIFDTVPPPKEPVKVLNDEIDGVGEIFPADYEDEDTSTEIKAPSQGEVSSTYSTYNIDQDLDGTAARISAEELNDTKLSAEEDKEFETGENQSTNNSEGSEFYEHFPELPRGKVLNDEIDMHGILDTFLSDNKDEDTSTGSEGSSQSEGSSTQPTHDVDQDSDDTASSTSMSSEESDDTEYSTETDGHFFETGENQSTNKQELMGCSEYFTRLHQALQDTIPTMSSLTVLKLCNIHFGETLFQLSTKMVSLQVVSLYNVSMSLECFEGFVENVATFHKTVLAYLRNILVHPETQEEDLLVSISSKCNLVSEERLLCEKPISGLKKVYFINRRDISQEQIIALISLTESKAYKIYV